MLLDRSCPHHPRGAGALWFLQPPARRVVNGTRMVAALASRELVGSTVNRKRVQRLMRGHAVMQPKRSEGRKKRPGYVEVTLPDELWHTDMTSVWVAEHGWV